MVNPLIGLHAFLGEFAAIGFLWIFIELINPNVKSINRIKIVAIISVILIFLSWFAGGYYYVNTYGSEVKPIIKAGPQPWAHLVFTETKEHIFLFLPFLSLFALTIIKKYDKALIKNKSARIATMILSLLIFLLAFAIGGMGYLISQGARAALEVGI